ncbi:hypothetical protein BVRB_6g148360 [Beta vulgaris subsp. vulgaris]|nr:hypothetical protein BVRB_6g148360 [Beta vulgaris subsp. vulgaris]
MIYPLISCCTHLIQNLDGVEERFHGAQCSLIAFFKDTQFES